MCLFTLTNSHVDASSSTNGEKQKLIQSLSEDKEFVMLLMQTFELAVTAQQQNNPQTAKNPIAFERQVSDAMQGYKNLSTKYPVLIALSSTERQAVLRAASKQVLTENTSNARINNIRGCTMSSIRTWAICNGLNGAWTLARFTICAGVAAVGDLLVIAATGGVVLAASLVAVTDELAACAAIAAGNPITAGGLLVCNGFFAENLSACWGGH